MVPLEALVIPMYLTLRDADLLNLVPVLVATYMAFVLPFTVWTLRGFVAALPVELEEAAMIDGASRWGAFWRITFPLMAPGLVATAVFAFIQAWNEFILALTLMEQGNQTLPVWLGTFKTAQGIDWGGLMAGSTLVAIPVVVFRGRAAGPDRDRGCGRRGQGMSPLGGLADAVLLPGFAGTAPPDWVRRRVARRARRGRAVRPQLRLRDQVARADRGAAGERAGVAGRDRRGGRGRHPAVRRDRLARARPYALGVVDDVALTRSVSAALAAPARRGRDRPGRSRRWPT